MRSTIPIILTMIIAGGLFSSGAAISRAAASEEFSRSYAVSPGTQLEVKNVNGTVRIVGADVTEVGIKAIKETRRNRDELDLVTIEITNTGGILLIDTVYHRAGSRNNSTFFERLVGGMSGSWPQVNVNYTITVPRNLTVRKASSVNGAVEITGTTGDGSFSTTNGDIVVRETSGTITANTTNGDISVSGSVKVTRASTVNGSIDVQYATTTMDAEFSTVNGSIEIGLPANPSVELDLKTVNGRVTLGGMMLRVDTISNKNVQARAGNGGPRLVARTVNGSIALREGK